MTSATFTPTTTCMKFSYYMYGISMGTLMVHKVVNGEREATALWTVTGNQGQVWKESQVEITSATNFQVAFVAKKGTSWESDMAVDEIMFTPGACTATQKDSPVESRYEHLLRDAEEKIKDSQLAIKMVTEAAKRDVSSDSVAVAVAPVADVPVTDAVENAVAKADLVAPIAPVASVADAPVADTPVAPVADSVAVAESVADQVAVAVAAADFVEAAPVAEATVADAPVAPVADAVVSAPEEKEKPAGTKE